MTKIAVITGASRGIGKSIAQVFAREGYTLALCAVHTRELELTAAEIQAETLQPVKAILCNVADSSAVEAMQRTVLREMGVPSVVVNNAGVVKRNLVEDSSDELWNSVLSVNLTGAFYVTRAFLPSMRAQNEGRFIHVASISAHLGTPKLSAYCASKWGLLGFHKSLSEELRGSPLLSFAVSPGSVDTDMLKGSGFTPQMSPADVARTVLFCASAPQAMHGAVIEMFGNHGST